MYMCLKVSLQFIKEGAAVEKTNRLWRIDSPKLLICNLQIFKDHGVDFTGKAEQHLEPQRRPMTGVADDRGGLQLL